MIYKNSYNDLGGEMLAFERRFLFEKIIQYKPNIVIEVGSGSGGSTRIILLALNHLNNGILYNCDPYNSAAIDIVDINTNRMIYQQTSGKELIQQLLNNNIIPDFIFFDGPEEPDIVLSDFKLLDQSVLDNCIFISHDWEHDHKRIDNNISIKSQKLKPYLHKINTWTILEELSGIDGKYPNNNGYNSVGMVCAIKKDNG